MISQTSNQIGYSGALTARLRSNGHDTEYLLTNAGCKPLWDAAAKAFAGYNVSDSIPKYFDIVDPNMGYGSLLARSVPFTNIVWGEVVDKSLTSTSVSFTAVVTSGEKLRASASGNIELHMLNSKGEVMAKIADPSLLKLYKSITPGIDAVFEWKLTFSNNSPTV